MRLLLIEDDELLGGGLRDFFRVDGHAVEWARRLGAVEAYRGEPFDAYLPTAALDAPVSTAGARRGDDSRR
jgi:DNA-binding response OmpR family regulator